MAAPLTLEHVKQIIADQLGIDAETIKPETMIVEDLGAGSFDLVDMITAFEEAYELEVEKVDFDRIKTVEDVFKYIKEQVENQKK